MAADNSLPKSGRVIDSRARSGALPRGLHVIEVLVDAAAPMTVGDIAAATGLESNTVHRLVEGLVDHGYAVRHPASKRLTAGPRALFPKRLYHPLTEGRRQMRARLADLKDAHGETTSFTLFIGYERVIVDSVQGSEHLGPYYDDIWMKAPVHGSISGQILLMEMSAAERRLLIGPGPYAAVTEHTITDPAELDRRLERLREKGHGAIHDTLFLGVTAIGAPVRVRDKIVGCLVVTGTTARLDVSRAEIVGADLKAAADLVNRGTPALRAVGHLLGA